MNWEKTVIHNKGCMAEGYITGGIYGDKKIYYNCTCGREAQAEITWKARDNEVGDARKAGQRDVVEWIDKNMCCPYPVGSVGYIKWQKKRKRWGL